MEKIMGKKIRFVAILFAILLVIVPDTNFGQVPNLGSASEFTLFTGNGGITNINKTVIYGGAVGTNTGPIVGFDAVNCIKHNTDQETATCKTDLKSVIDEISAILNPQTITPTSLSGGTFTPGVYLVASAVTLSIDLTLDAKGDPNAQFIFKISGAFNVGAAVKMILINGAQVQNVFWKVDAAVGFGAATSIKGNFLVLSGAIALGAGVTLEGRALTMDGEITLDNVILATCLLPAKPSTTIIQPTCSLATGTITVTSPKESGMTYSIDGISFINTTGVFRMVPTGQYTVIAKNQQGCMSWSSVTINGNGQGPNLGTAADFLLFTTKGAIGNTGGATKITGGALGTDFGALTGFAGVDCEKHIEDVVTVQCSLDLLAAFNEIHNIPKTDTIPAANLPLSGTYTPGVYLINSAVTLTTTLTLDAQGDPNALFIFNITGAFWAAAYTQLFLINGATANNIFWNVDGAVGMGTLASMKGSFLSLAGAIDMGAEAVLEGRALTIDGAINIYNNNISISICTRPVAPVLILTQPTLSTPTGSILITEPVDVGMKYRIDNCTYSNTDGHFNFVSPGTYTVSAMNSLGCISLGTTALITAASFIWVGTSSTDWNDRNNWSENIVPGITGNVIIPDGSTTPLDPVLPLYPPASVKTIMIQSGGIVDGGTATTLSLNGSSNAWINMGSFNAGTSDVVFNGSLSQTIGGTSTTTFNNLTSDNTIGVTLTCDALTTVTGSLTVNSGKAFVVASGKLLTVTGTITNNAGTSGLILQSNALGTASLIHNSDNLAATVQRYMLENKWHVVSAPAIENNNTFLNRNLSIPNLVDGTNEVKLGMMDYNIGENKWNMYFSGGSSGSGESFTVGKGYMVRTAVSIDSPAPTIIDFQGILNAGIIDVTLNSTGANGWNCIGNPYTSTIKIADGVVGIGTDNFIDVNKDIIDNVYFGVYIFNGTSYDIVNYTSASATELYASLGQGFFIKAKTDNTKISFNNAMQTHHPIAYKSSTTAYPTIKLLATSNLSTVSTEIKFVDGATIGLDKGYDAGIFKSDPSFAIYTKLVEPFDAEFQLQCLPTNQYTNLVIPIGIDSKAGGEIVFSVETVQLEAGCKVILEDRLTNTFTDLSTGSYKVSVIANTAGTGRFYLHNCDIISHLEEQVLPGKITAYVKGNKEIRIIGEVGNDAVATMYNGLGKVVLSKKLGTGTMNIIDLPNPSSGVYLLNINNNGTSQTIKVMVRK